METKTYAKDKEEEEIFYFKVNQKKKKQESKLPKLEDEKKQNDAELSEPPSHRAPTFKLHLPNKPTSNVPLPSQPSSGTSTPNPSPVNPTRKSDVILIKIFTRPTNSSPLLTETFLRNGPNNIDMLSVKSLEPFLPSDIETSV